MKMQQILKKLQAVGWGERRETINIEDPSRSHQPKMLNNSSII